LRIGLIGDYFEGGNAEVDALRGALLVCFGYGFVEILFDFIADGADVDDGPFDRAQETI
jgi:hypothetical protein